MALTRNHRACVRRLIVGVLAVCFAFLLLGRLAAEPGKTPAAAGIRPFLQQHCIGCHGPDTAKAGLRLDTLPPDFADPEKARPWLKVLDRLRAGDMPPKTRTRPPEADTRQAVTFLHDNLLAADRKTQPPAGSLVLRRLNRVQYENTVRDLLDIDLELRDRLPPDTRAFGFDNVGSALSLSSAQLETYLDAADAALDAAIVNRPRPAGIKQRTSGLEARRSTRSASTAHCWSWRRPRSGSAGSSSIRTAIPSPKMAVTGCGRRSSPTRAPRSPSSCTSACGTWPATG